MSGFQSPLKGIERFKSVFKISKTNFDYICSLVEENLLAKTGDFSFRSGKHLSLCDQVAIALRRLSSSDSLMSIGDSCGLRHSTVSQVTWRFVEAMEQKGIQHLQWPSETEMVEIKSKFEKIQGRPNCCGVIDTTHILMCLPSSDPTNNRWLDRMKNHSMVLQAIVDPQMRFPDIVTGWPGKTEDRLIFHISIFYKFCDERKSLNGKILELSEGSEIREYIIGDSGYLLLPYLVTPYKGRELPELGSEFNRWHSATHMVAQMALGRLKDKWKIIQEVMWRPDKHKFRELFSFAACFIILLLIWRRDAG